MCVTVCVCVRVFVCVPAAARCRRWRRCPTPRARCLAPAIVLYNRIILYIGYIYLRLRSYCIEVLYISYVCVRIIRYTSLILRRDLSASLLYCEGRDHAIQNARQHFRIAAAAQRFADTGLEWATREICVGLFGSEYLKVEDRRQLDYAPIQGQLALGHYKGS